MFRSHHISSVALANLVHCTVVKKYVDSEEASNKLAKNSVNRLVSVKSDE